MVLKELATSTFKMLSATTVLREAHGSQVSELKMHSLAISLLVVALFGVVRAGPSLSRVLQMSKSTTRTSFKAIKWALLFWRPKTQQLTQF
jgi:hypothetical protein